MFLSLLIGTITMDLSVIQKNQDMMGVQRFGNQYGSHIFNHKDTFTETDVKGNNNLFHSLKTENNDHGHDPSSLFQDDYTNEKNTRMETSSLTYSSFKKAIDLRVHNRTTDGGKRTIFEDADYFAKNFCYKLLPITFENVDETIIRTEHNYSLFSLVSESEAEEDCSRTMDYSQIKEKNYKRRRTKFREGSEENEWDGKEDELDSVLPQEADMELVSQSDHSFAIQPLDLSSPLVQEEKTDRHIREHPTSIVNKEEEDKENLKSKLGCIEVTITRPDEKENYQPCDLFLNDIARLVPRLIERDCSEIDILDRTCGRGHIDKQTHRLYYIISESTWELFQSTKERIILTNDDTLGEPVQKRGKIDRPTFLVFDQFSLAKCLADHCREIGGCFEYTFVEATKSLEEEVRQEESNQEEVVKVQLGVLERDSGDEELKNAGDGSEMTVEEVNTVEEEVKNESEENVMILDEAEVKNEENATNEEEMKDTGEENVTNPVETEINTGIEKEMKNATEENVKATEKAEKQIGNEEETKTDEEKQTRSKEEMKDANEENVKATEKAEEHTGNEEETKTDEENVMITDKEEKETRNKGEMKDAIEENALIPDKEEKQTRNEKETKTEEENLIETIPVEEEKVQENIQKRESKPQNVKPEIEGKRNKNEAKTEVKPKGGKKPTIKKPIKKGGKNKKATKTAKPKEVPPPKPNLGVRTRSKSTSESETPNNTKTSQNRDKLKRRTNSKEEEVPPMKRSKINADETEENAERKTRSGKSLGEGSQTPKKTKTKAKSKKKKEKGRKIEHKQQQPEEEKMTTRLRPRKAVKGTAKGKQGKLKPKMR